MLINKVFKYLGYVPFVSTVTGLGRVLFGIGKIAASIFNQAAGRTSSKKFTAKKGGEDIGRGLVEMIPIFGNLTVIGYDLYRQEHKFKKL